VVFAQKNTPAGARNAVSVVPFRRLVAIGCHSAAGGWFFVAAAVHRASASGATVPRST
jgi:hypothetical protein